MTGSHALILDNQRRLLLRAALGEGADRTDAYYCWQRTVRVDDIDAATYKMIPLLLKTSEDFGFKDRLTPQMRGISRHVWITNMLRLRMLSQAHTALTKAKIDFLLLKGAALFARHDRLTALYVTGDYDIQVHRSDASAAAQALMEAQFSSFAPLTEFDFESTHAANFFLQNGNGSLDLHWRPLPLLRDESYVSELFANAESAKLLDQSVSVPSLADHLFLTVVRPEPWDADEMFHRAVEATHILRGCQGELDWQRFQDLVLRYRLGWIAGSMLSLIRDEVHAPIPDDLPDRIWRHAGTFKNLELAYRGVPPYQRPSIKRFVLKILEITRSHSDSARSALTGVLSLLWRPRLRAQLVEAVRSELLPYLNVTAELERVWRVRAACETRFDNAGPAFVQGFFPAEKTGRWAGGGVAILEIPVNSPLGAEVPVRLVFRPFFALDKTEFQCDIKSGSMPTIRYSFENSHKFHMILGAEVVGLRARKIVIVLRPLDASAPCEHGFSKDSRVLGLFMEHVELSQDQRGSPVTSVPRTTAWTLGVPTSRPDEAERRGIISVLGRRRLRDSLVQTFRRRLSRQEVGRLTELKRLWLVRGERESRFDRVEPFFVQGFSLAEETGRWTDGRFALLEIPVETPLGTKTSVRLVVRPFIAPGITKFDCQFVTRSNSTTRYSFYSAERCDLVLEAEAVGVKARKIVIAIHLPDAGSPVEYGLSNDARLLGLFIERIDIFPPLVH